MVANPPLKASSFTIADLVVRQSAWRIMRARDDRQDFGVDDDESNYPTQGAFILRRCDQR
jgi:hypothetical protein